MYVLFTFLSLKSDKSYYKHSNDVVGLENGNKTYMYVPHKYIVLGVNV